MALSAEAPTLNEEQFMEKDGMEDEYCEICERECLAKNLA